MIVVPAAAAQAAIAREHGRSSWAGLKQACTQESHTLAQLRWLGETDV
jgi:hypothetical protein